MVELEMVCYYTLSLNFKCPCALFELHQPTQMDKGVKFVSVNSMKLYKHHLSHRARRNMGTRGQDFFKTSREKWFMWQRSLLWSYLWVSQSI